MKKLWLCLFIAAGLLLNFTSLFAHVVVTNSVKVDISNTFTSLFQSLSKGDLKTIKFFLSPEEFAEFKVLFEQNKDYPAFLRNYYQGATLRVGQIHSVRSATDDVIAEFIVDFPGGDTRTTRIRLRRNRPGEWKIRKVLAGDTDQGEPSGKGRR